MMRLRTPSVSAVLRRMTAVGHHHHDNGLGSSRRRMTTSTRSTTMAAAARTPGGRPTAAAAAAQAPPLPLPPGRGRPQSSYAAAASTAFEVEDDPRGGGGLGNRGLDGGGDDGRALGSVDADELMRRRVIGNNFGGSSIRMRSALQQETVADEEDDELLGLVREYARIPQTAASLQMLLKTGRGEMLGKSYKAENFEHHHGGDVGGQKHKQQHRHLATDKILIQMASLLRREIPIRMAHRIRDLSRVPLLRDMPSVKAVQRVYLESFRTLLDVPPISSNADEEKFSALLGELYAKHANVLVQMARGAYELRERVKTGSIPGKATDDDWEFARMNECHAFLDRFYMSRIGIRVLAGQYLALRESNPPPDTIGLICLRTSPRDVVRQAADDARRLCRKKYGRAPLIELSGRLDLTFPYIPTYLHYMVLELIKNALRATCEHHGSGPLPKVEVVIADGHDHEDVAIKIADEGGGIRRSQVHKIWSYLYTTADPAVQRSFLKKHDHEASDSSPIAGLGYGLPISRAYCRYFGGAMDLVSMEGFGTDAFLHLKRLGDEDEPLPV